MNEAELLFTEVLRCDRASLYQNPNATLGRNNSRLISSALKRRIKGEPIQYILGKTEFMGLEFKLDRGVLIPRPETEILVETVIKIVSGFRIQASGLNVLDVGTGSGCIAVSLAKFLKDIRVTATDISEKAITVAKENAALNKVEDKIDFIRQDLFGLQLAACSMRPNLFDFIVSNPPYVLTAEIERLQPEIKFEPRIALDGGSDGLDFYRRIIKEAPCYLVKGGCLIIEIGFNQKGLIENIFHNSAIFEIIEIVKDYNNIDRVIVAQRKQELG
ncbi:MAG: peptide chain release factor N(5)-glutamine methyltransferase [Candidatus Omnitrophica bacterium]|nr:peptide chain release factor N(5)-glutamine methyltransferase [Candidatus Omnitrophota bacterium]